MTELASLHKRGSRLTYSGTTLCDCHLYILYHGVGDIRSILELNRVERRYRRSTISKRYCCAKWLRQQYRKGTAVLSGLDINYVFLHLF
jgi:hypothetical protein